MFPGVPVCSCTAPRVPGRKRRGLDIIGSFQMKLGMSGCLWTYLGSSRMFWHMHVLAGQSYRYWVGVAHGGSRIEVEGIREQLGGQRILCIEV